MVHTKNYETTSNFVKVMPRIPWPYFFPDTVYFVAINMTGYWHDDSVVTRQSVMKCIVTIVTKR